MVDIHSHIIPCVDDGSKSFEISKKLAKQYVENGIYNVICTPHQNFLKNNKELIINSFNLLKEELKDYGINFYLGSEIYYYENIIADLNEKKLLTFNNTKYILIEFSFNEPINIVDALYDVIKDGYKPIIAHIERYDYLTKDDYFKIKELGVLIQVNSKSFEKKHYVKKLKFLLKNNLIDFIASDCHNDVNRNVDFTVSKQLISKKYKNQYEKIFNNDDFLKNITL